MSTPQVWSIPLIKDNEKAAAAETIPMIVQKNNLAIYAHILLSGDQVEGE